jgi:sulfate transport system substrate-binding protein
MKATILGLAVAATLAGSAQAADISLLNASYDPTRELYTHLNDAFAVKFKADTGKSIEVKTSNGGSGAQARAVIDGLEADVVTLALAYDVDAIADRGLIAPDWQSRLPNNSTPYTSTIVFLARKGNPKGIKDWDDLVKPGVQVITPNPKTSGGARWNYLAAWGYALKKLGGEDKAREFVKAVYANVPVLDTGARGSTVTFVERGKDKFDIVVPSLSILAEPPVAVVDKVVDRKGTRAPAESFLQFIYSRQGQTIAAKDYYRPRDPDVAKEFEGKFPKLDLITINDFGGWRKAQTTHFADHGVFDSIYSQ